MVHGMINKKKNPLPIALTSLLRGITLFAVPYEVCSTRLQVDRKNDPHHSPPDS